MVSHLSTRYQDMMVDFQNKVQHWKLEGTSLTLAELRITSQSGQDS